MDHGFYYGRPISHAQGGILDFLTRGQEGDKVCIKTGRESERCFHFMLYFRTGVDCNILVCNINRVLPLLIPKFRIHLALEYNRSLEQLNYLKLIITLHTDCKSCTLS